MNRERPSRELIIDSARETDRVIKIDIGDSARVRKLLQENGAICDSTEGENSQLVLRPINEEQIIFIKRLLIEKGIEHRVVTPIHYFILHSDDAERVKKAIWDENEELGIDSSTQDMEPGKVLLWVNTNYGSEGMYVLVQKLRALGIPYQIR